MRHSSEKILTTFVIGTTGIALLIALNFRRASVHAQNAAKAVPDWQRAAGGKLAFEVASIKPGNPAKPTPSNFTVDAFDNFDTADPHGHFVASLPLQAYVLFAYKLLYARDQKEAMVAHLPKWFSTDEYVINAQAEGDPTKDQVRLMMQSLLADRFKLAVHFERQELPVLALVLDKPEKTGPKFYPHSKGLPCDGPFPRNVIVAAPTKSTDVFPPFCDKVLQIGLPNGSILMGGRDLTMAQIAAMLSGSGRLPHFVVDRTGLDGRFDFTLEWSNPPDDLVPRQEAQALPGASYQVALQEQLGLKLQSTKASIDTLVVDHVERPSEN